jgi:DNA-binding response OmpR family regulator
MGAACSNVPLLHCSRSRGAFVATILVISADPQACDALRGALTAEGHLVTNAASGDEGLRALHTLRADLVALDLAAPGLPAEQFCRWLRADPDRKQVPVLFLGPRIALQVEGVLPSALRPGLDAYIGRPFDADGVADVVAGLLVGGGAMGPARPVRAGPLSLDPVRRFLRWEAPTAAGRDSHVHLTAIECRLLREFMEKPGLVLSTEELLVRVWGFYPGTGGAEVLRAHVRNLRRKLEDLHEGAEILVTVPRVGYRLSTGD